MSGQDNNQQQDRGLFSGLYNKVHGVSTESTKFDGNYSNNQNQGNYNQGQGNYNQGQGNYNQGQGNYNQGQGNYNQGQGSYNQGQGNYNQGYPQGNQGQGNYNQGGAYNPSAGANPPAGQNFQGNTCVPPPNQQGNAGCVNYNSTIALKHNNTGRFLSSTNSNYNSGSGQQQIFCNQWSVGGTEIWEVLPAYQSGGSGPVQFNQRIRLRHRQTGRYLHSHPNINSPISQFQEVSGYGNQNQSDNNDDWIVEKFTYNNNKEGGNWNTMDAFALKHCNTGLYLYSHDRGLNVNGVNGTEVACYGNGSDENNKWRLQLA